MRGANGRWMDRSTVERRVDGGTRGGERVVEGEGEGRAGARASDARARCAR